MARHFGLYQESKLSVTQRKGRYGAVKSSQLSWTGQYKKCVQYYFQFTLEYVQCQIYRSFKFQIFRWKLFCKSAHGYFLTADCKQEFTLS